MPWSNVPLFSCPSKQIINIILLLIFMPSTRVRDRFILGKINRIERSHIASVNRSRDNINVSIINFIQFSQSLFYKGTCIFVSSIGSSFLDIALNLAALECFKGQNLPMWLQAIHGAFGIGGLLGPFAVYLFQLHSLTVLGVVILITVFFYCYLQTPQKIQKDKKQQQQQQTLLQIPRLTLILISLCFFFVVGQQVTYSGWISSYAVLYGFSTKQHATFYSSLYWISITFFRFALALIAGKPSNKVQKLALGGVITCFISVLLIFQVNHQFGLISMSILFGLFDSVLYPLLLTIPQQFGYKLTVSEGSTFIISGSLGEGCLGVVVGKMMSWFNYNWLIYSLFFMNACIFIAIRYNSSYMLKNKEQYDRIGKLGKFIEDSNGNIGRKRNSGSGDEKVRSLEMKLIEK